MNDQGETTTHFGFETVSEADKADLVQGVFGSVASKYDIMNDVMSGGVHRIWKDAMMDWLAPRAGQRLLDVAGGTGDIAFRMLDSGAQITVSDINQEMLDVGIERAMDRGVDDLVWSRALKAFDARNPHLIRYVKRFASNALRPLLDELLADHFQRSNLHVHGEQVEQRNAKFQ